MTEWTLRVYNGDGPDGDERVDERMTYASAAEALLGLVQTVDEYAGDGFTAANFHNRLEVRGDQAVRFVCQTEDGEDDSGVCPVYAEIRQE